VWFSYFASCTGIAEATTCAPGSANFDTVVAVYDAGCGPGSMALLGCNDDFCGLQSKVVFPVTNNGHYLIEVGGYNGAQGNFAISLGCASTFPAPHDACANAILLPVSWAIDGSNWGASNSNAPVCGPQNDVWYKFVAEKTGPCIVTTCNATTGSVGTLDTFVSVFGGTCGALSFIACNDDSCSLKSTVNFNAVAGTTYYVSIGGFSGFVGQFGLKIDQPSYVDLDFWDWGPGTIAFNVSGVGSKYYLFVTTDGTNFPNGWFFGINPTVAEVNYQATAGYPFQDDLFACTIKGPFGPLPPGLTVYGVVFSAAAIGGPANGVSTPKSFTIY
jgi:hypothetical protein